MKKIAGWLIATSPVTATIVYGAFDIGIPKMALIVLGIIMMVIIIKIGLDMALDD